MSTRDPIEHVSDTAFWVAHYRAVESRREDALFNDPFAERLTDERGKKIADSMEGVSLYSEFAVITRTVIIDRFIYQLIEDGVDTIINLGAGLDARPYRMDLPAELDWIEVDHPGIVAHKEKILASETPKCRLTRVAADLADDELRKTFLKSVAPQSKKVLIVTEGVIPYLSADHVANLAKELSAQERFTYWITEYFHPDMYTHLQHPARTAVMKRAPFQFYPPNWFDFFRDLGWVEKETAYSSKIAMEFGRELPMSDVAKRLLPTMSQEAKEAWLRRSGYTILERAM